MTIRPGIGFDKLKFGMTEEEVIDLIGRPTKIIVDEEDEDQNPVYQYNELKLRLTFYNEYDRKLGYIRTSNPMIEVNGQPIIGVKVEEVFKAYVVEITDWRIERYFTFNSYFYEAKWTTLNVEYGVVTDIEYGYLFDETGENPVWPE